MHVGVSNVPGVGHADVADGVERELVWAGCQLPCDVSECVVVVGGGIVVVVFAVVVGSG